MDNTLALTNCKNHNWFACNDEEGIVASSETLSELLNMFHLSHINRLGADMYIVSEGVRLDSSNNNKEDLKSYLVYPLNKLEKKGYSVEDPKNTWRKNNKSEDLKFERFAGFIDRTKIIINFYNYFDNPKIRSNETYSSCREFIVNNNLLSDVLTFIKSTKDLLSLIDSKSLGSNNLLYLNLLSFEFEKYISFAKCLLSDSILPERKRFSHEYPAVIAYWLSTVENTLMKKFPDGVCVDKLLNLVDNETSSDKEIVVECSNRLNNNLKVLNSLYPCHLEDFPVFTLTELSELFYSYVSFLDVSEDYAFEKSKPVLNMGEVGRLHYRLSLSVRNLEEVYTSLNCKYPAIIGSGKSFERASLGMYLLDTVFERINDNFKTEYDVQLLTTP